MIIVNKATDVSVLGDRRGNGGACVRVELSLADTDARDMFYNLWEAYGNDWLNELIKVEGYSLIKNEHNKQETPVCRGSLALGTGCGSCRHCKQENAQMSVDGVTALGSKSKQVCKYCQNGRKFDDQGYDRGPCTVCGGEKVAPNQDGTQACKHLEWTQYARLGCEYCSACGLQRAKK